MGVERESGLTLESTAARSLDFVTDGPSRFRPERAERMHDEDEDARIGGGFVRIVRHQRGGCHQRRGVRLSLLLPALRGEQRPNQSYAGTAGRSHNRAGAPGLQSSGKLSWPSSGA